MKRLFSKIRVFLHKVSWVLRRSYNKFKGHLLFFLSKCFNTLSRKTHREAKKQVKQDFFKDYLKLDNYDIDLRLDIDPEQNYVDIKERRKEVAFSLKEEQLSLKELKKNNPEQYNEFMSLYAQEKQRIKHIYEERYILAKELYDKILKLEYETNKKIRAIQNTKNFQDDSIEELRVAKGREVTDLKVDYHEQTKIVLKDTPSTKIDNKYLCLKIEEDLLKHAKTGLPESRKKIETKDKVRQNSKSLLQALIYLAPAMVFLLVFTFYPIVNAFRLVFVENYDEVNNVTQGITLFGNFLKVLKDPNFIVPGQYVKSSAMINTLLIVGVTVPISIIISLLISVLLNGIKKLSNVFQTIFFLPYVTNSLAVGLVFAYMFQTNGLFNKFLRLFSVDGGSWIQHGAPYWKAMFVLMLFSIWNGLAFKIMVFLSAIQGIDKQYYQAASIDATPRFKQFRRITAPLISPTILYIVITSVIGAFKTYSSVIAIFGNSGRPAGAPYHLKTIVFYIYDYFNYTGKMPEAAAASIVLFGIILLMTLIQMQVSKKRVHY